MEARTQLVRLVLFAIAVSELWTFVSSYSLSSNECKSVVRTIGMAIKTTKSNSPVVRGTWVSPRCEDRRIQDPDSDGEKTFFLLRMFEIQSRRRWTGHYFFYRDKDCREPAYGVKLEGNVAAKSHNITFNFSTVKIATYRQDVDKTFHMIYNRSCPGHTRTANAANPIVYDVDKSVSGRRECLKAFGIGHEEFSNAFIQSHTLKEGKVEGMLLRTVNLGRNIVRSTSSVNKAPVTYQWALRRHDFPACLTCTKVGMANLRNPPKLLARNSSSVDGAWGSAHCHQADNKVYTSRFDKFVGNTFESSVFASFSSFCEVPSFELRTLGTLQRVSHSVEVPGGVVYKMTVTQAYLTCYTNNLARVLNMGNCGKDTWAAGKTQDLMPTKGCDVVGYQLGAPELVLIRAVRDEKRNELYLGIDPYGKRHLSGPVDYNYVSQDCTSFPVGVATPSPRVEVTTAPDLTWPTRRNTRRIEEESMLIKRNLGTITPSGGAPRSSTTPKSLLCFLVFVMAAMKLD